MNDLCLQTEQIMSDPEVTIMPINNEVGFFVDVVRQECFPADQSNQMTQNRPHSHNRRSNIEQELEDARNKAENTLIEAEILKGTVEPPGKTFEQILNIGSGVSDDDFFHLTCHIEPNLIYKIEKGEFVELEKLLPKEKLGCRSQEENRLEWVQRDGGTYLVPMSRDNKIGSFRHWEQAFRTYVTIYCGANPHRVKEIWQYITVINTVATAYTWENVYNYDITFRHLMAFNPQRSWAVTYNQMWNLSMRDPLPKNFGKSFSSHSGGGYAMSKNQSNSYPKRNKSDYCWNFNKGVPCRFGSKCKFIERCKYCDSPTHGVHACQKLQKKEGGHNNNNNNRNIGGSQGGQRDQN